MEASQLGDVGIDSWGPCHTSLDIQPLLPVDAERTPAPVHASTRTLQEFECQNNSSVAAASLRLPEAGHVPDQRDRHPELGMPPVWVIKEGAEGTVDDTMGTNEKHSQSSLVSPQARGASLTRAAWGGTRNNLGLYILLARHVELDLAFAMTIGRDQSLRVDCAVCYPHVVVELAFAELVAMSLSPGLV